jgi:hypothetical protein
MTDKWNTHPNQYVKRKMLVLWNQAVLTDREVTANRPYIILKNTREKTCILMDGSTRRQKSHKMKQKKATEEFMYTGAMNVEQEMYDNTSNNWSHWNSNKRFKEKFGSYTEKRFKRLTTKAILGISHIIQKVLQSET